MNQPLFQFRLIPPLTNTVGTLDDILVLLLNTIQILLVFVGIVAVIFIIIGGYRYIASFGNPEGQLLAKQTLLYAIVGVVIALGAFIIVRTVWTGIVSDQLRQIQTGPPDVQSTSPFPPQSDQTPTSPFPPNSQSSPSPFPPNTNNQ